MTTYGTELSRLMKAAEEQGWRITKTTNGHWQFYSPNNKDIVMFGGDHGTHDYRGWKNSMAAMYRAGFTDAKTNLGDELKKAMAPKQPQEPGNKDPIPYAQIVLDSLKHGAKTTADLLAIAKSIRSDANTGNISNAASTLKAKGLISNPERGFWKLGEQPKEEARIAAPAPPIPSPHISGESTGDSKIDEDLRILDAALAALAQVESVVRRHRDLMHERAKLKKMLEGIL